ncbi:MAG TPA: ChuX/HutX family heme-like substrate-binding protein [Planctomycetota bacterium]|jgi:putative hemin transport protein
MADSAADLATRVRSALEKEPLAMTLLLAHQLGVPEAEIVRALPDGRSCELELSRWEELIRSFPALQKVHVICSNAAVTLEAVGQFGGFSTAGIFFNVQTPSIDMHIRHAQLGSVFAVEKPGHVDGVPTVSFQFFDRAGHAAFKVFLTFGGSAPDPKRMSQFVELREKFRAHRA